MMPAETLERMPESAINDVAQDAHQISRKGIFDSYFTPLKAPFPYFGGKSCATDVVWQAFGLVDNYVEPFSGSAAMLLGAPDGKRTETINDADGFVANFWRAIAHDPAAVAHHADWPCNEVDLFARHSWLVRQTQGLTNKLHADPAYFDAQIAGWWCWGNCNWIAPAGAQVMARGYTTAPPP